MSPENLPAPRRLRKLTAKISISERTWLASFRFVREVERIEREGRVKSRTALELLIGIKAGTISQIRAGRNDASLGMAIALREALNADLNYIMYGVRVPELAEPLFPLPGRTDDLFYKPVVHEYKAPAGWKIGPMAEAVAAHYPDDPKNSFWQPHKDSPARVRARANESGGLKTETPDQ
ncbi:MAG: helix-turn-helix domain-containing protein [Janthinobacterium lividum]